MEIKQPPNPKKKWNCTICRSTEYRRGLACAICKKRLCWAHKTYCIRLRYKSLNYLGHVLAHEECILWLKYERLKSHKKTDYIPQYKG